MHKIVITSAQEASAVHSLDTVGRNTLCQTRRNYRWFRTAVEGTCCWTAGIHLDRKFSQLAVGQRWASGVRLIRSCRAVPISRRSAVHAAQVQDEPSEGHRMGVVGGAARRGARLGSIDGIAPIASLQAPQQTGGCMDGPVVGWGHGAEPVWTRRETRWSCSDETKWSFVRPAATHRASYELFFVTRQWEAAGTRARGTRTSGLGGIPYDRGVDPRGTSPHGTARVASLRLAWPARALEWKRVPRFGCFIRFRSVVVWRETKLVRARHRAPLLTGTWSSQDTGCRRRGQC
jgi:hypothetical protein